MQLLYIVAIVGDRVAAKEVPGASSGRGLTVGDPVPHGHLLAHLGRAVHHVQDPVGSDVRLHVRHRERRWRHHQSQRVELTEPERLPEPRLPHVPARAPAACIGTRSDRKRAPHQPTPAAAAAPHTHANTDPALDISSTCPVSVLLAICAPFLLPLFRYTIHAIHTFNYQP